MNDFLTRFEQLGAVEFKEHFFRVTQPFAWATQPHISALREGYGAFYVAANELSALDRGAGPFANGALCTIADLAADLVLGASLPAGTRAKLLGMAVEYVAPAQFELFVTAEADLTQGAANSEHTVTVEMKNSGGAVVCKATLRVLLTAA